MSVSELLWLGLAEQKAKETAKNTALTELLTRLAAQLRDELAKAGVDSAILPKPMGTLVYQLGTRAKPQIEKFLPLVVRHIASSGIKNDVQLSAAVEFLLSHTVSGVDEEAFKLASGIGVVVSPAQIEDTVNASIAKHREQLLTDRYSFPFGKILGEVRQSLQWADGAAVKREVDLRVLELLGPKTDEELLGGGKKGPQQKKDEKPANKKENGGVAKQEAKKNEDATTTSEDGAETIEELMRTRAHFHRVGENFKTEGYVITPKTDELLKKHVQEVGGKVRTRFPPEPNGILHIGHAKAININFGYAKAHGGTCNLRFDDTNPEKEEAKFFHAIEDIVRWLGYTPARITYSSDNFEQLYKWAVQLIEKDLAYVCHQTVDEMRGFDVKQSPWRNRPVAESLRLFEDMKNGKFEEGAATLRLKMTLEEGKVDPVAYRIKFTPHHRTGDTWCIYPTYDYTHCLCDSIENITHSLCTKEFQSRRSSYYWLCNALDIYCPVQWEYGRLNVNYTVVSKRKILKLITTKTVGDWDDPRLFTLTALRRRGIPPEAINAFVARLGLTMSQMAIDPHALDAATRDYLNIHAPRTMAVLEGLRLRIENFDELKMPNQVEVPDFPSDPASKKHRVVFDREVFIERSDYRGDDSEKGFRRLTPTQPVGLKAVGLVLSVVKEEKNANGELTGVVVRAEQLNEQNKPKAFVHWVAKPLNVEVRLYERLFLHPNPEDPAVVPGGFLSDCNKDSLRVLHHALVDEYLKDAHVLDRFQFERVGYFAVDEDSRPGHLVFNRTVLLKEDAGKN